MLLETYFDYEIHRECFRVFDSASYVRTTDTLLKLVSTEENVINYFEATLSIDVLRNIGDGVVGLYDNGKLLQLIEFNENTSTINDLTVRLNYNVDHSLEAKFLGNDECLPSKSISIPLFVEMPVVFNTVLEFINLPPDNTIDNPTPYETLTLNLSDANGNMVEGATIKVFVDEESTPVTLTTDENGVAVLYSPQHWNSDVMGLHTFKAIFETTMEYYGAETRLALNVGYITNITPNATKYIIGQTPTFNIETKRYNGEPAENIDVTLWRG